MSKKFKLSFKQLVVILVLIFLIIMSESLKYLMLTKNIKLMEEFIKKSNYILTEESYILSNIMEYFFIVINFIILAIFSYFTRNKVKIDKLYKVVYFFIIVLTLLYETVLSRNTYYNYISIILQVILLLYVLNLNKQEED